ncbi:MULTISPECIES: pyruvate formate-lyase-activating protein [unclassified Fusibacter]|uniref:pyruvate formate-lyase-activating protein n=1 Tax=unclassified Fusibacter TaxID=2624464 RepID=UPI001010E159|nr:pyruvate formate-lyase-activating protein [Fusibacter sp. A1]MCK8058689.1 pyruvate formate-lyase-activating protein [Fusibacter sp. A2]NPE21763.1 pyruvate formate lyase-activating protein [Fusibacter sp. A1]RXV61337.1 pyruvate formate lyase-activating protein [Fusibacter sp. A1]
MGRIHAIESMGLLDGPGIRVVVFFQGCELRCDYCHNPDSWNMDGGTEYSYEELVKKVKRYQPYFKRSGGGVTCSGGEPLLQGEFLYEFLKSCKEAGIHTAIDTAGYSYDSRWIAKILEQTDLVILDIKHTHEEGFCELTGGAYPVLLKFIDLLNEGGSKVWVRHVVRPGVSDASEHLKSVEHLAYRLKNLERIEWLPYHTMGLEKYEKMGRTYLKK